MEFVYNPNDFAPDYGTARQVNNEFMGRHRGENWKDSTKFYYEQLAQREANAYNTAIMNYQNEYDSPLEQMKRYQAAGYNPMDALGKSNVSAAASPSGAARGTASKTQETAQRLNAMNSIVNDINSIVRGVADTKRAYQEMRYYDEAYPQMITHLTKQAEMDTTNAEYQPLFNDKRNSILMWNLLNSGVKGMEYAMDMGLSFRDLADIYMLGFNPTLDTDSVSYDRIINDYSRSYSWKNKIAGMNLRQRQHYLMKKKFEFEKKKFRESIKWREFEDREKQRHNQAMESLFGKGLWVKGGTSLLSGLFKAL